MLALWRDRMWVLSQRVTVIQGFGFDRDIDVRLLARLSLMAGRGSTVAVFD